jgi:hypothetical protein
MENLATGNKVVLCGYSPTRVVLPLQLEMVSVCQPFKED